MEQNDRTLEQLASTAFTDELIAHAQKAVKAAVEDARAAALPEKMRTE
jgi:hypothetical protein